MRALRDLLATWAKWSSRNTTVRALERATSEGHRDVLARSLAATPDVDPLDALRDSTELVALLTGWQWQAVYAARDRGASWADIGTATGTTGDHARAAYLAAIARQEHYGVTDVSAYREVL